MSHVKSTQAENWKFDIFSVSVGAQRVVLQQLQEVNGARREIIILIKCLFLFYTFLHKIN